MQLQFQDRVGQILAQVVSTMNDVAARREGSSGAHAEDDALLHHRRAAAESPGTGERRRGSAGRDIFLKVKVIHGQAHSGSGRFGIRANGGRASPCVKPVTKCSKPPTGRKGSPA